MCDFKERETHLEEATRDLESCDLAEEDAEAYTRAQCKEVPAVFYRMKSRQVSLLVGIRRSAMRLMPSPLRETSLFPLREMPHKVCERSRCVHVFSGAHGTDEHHSERQSGLHLHSDFQRPAGGFSIRSSTDPILSSWACRDDGDVYPWCRA